MVRWKIFQGKLIFVTRKWDCFYSLGCCICQLARAFPRGPACQTHVDAHSVADSGADWHAAARLICRLTADMPSPGWYAALGLCWAVAARRAAAMRGQHSFTSITPSSCAAQPNDRLVTKSSHPPTPNLTFPGGFDRLGIVAQGSSMHLNNLSHLIHQV